MPAFLRRYIPFIAVALATFAFAVLAHAGIDPADAGAAAAAGAALAATPELPASAHDAGVFIGIAAALGSVLRFAIIPLLRRFGLFTGLSLLVQHLILGILSAICGAAEAYGQGQGLIAAITAAGLAYAASQATFGATAGALEFRPKP